MDVKQLIGGALLALGLWGSAVTTAQADDPPAGEPSQGEAIVVRGAPDGPAGQYVRTRQAPRFERTELRQSFVRQIPRAVQQTPF